MIRRCLLVFMLVLLPFSSGCGVEHRDINELSIVLGAIFEYLPEENQYELYVQVAKPSAFSKNQGGGGEQENFIIYQGKGKSVFEAIRNASRKSNNRLFWSHCDIYVVDQNFARKGIFPLLDFMNRDNEVRETANLFVSEVPPHELITLKNGTDKVPMMALKKIARIGEQGTGSSFTVQIIDVLRDVVVRNSFALAPLVKKGSAQSEVEKQQSMFELYGAAVFNKDKMVGVLTPSETRGYMFVKNKLKNTLVVTKVRDKQVTFEVIKSKSKVIPQYTDGVFSLLVEIDVGVNYGEFDAPINLEDLNLDKEAQQAFNRVIAKEVEASIQRAKELKVDYFDFARENQVAYPQLWKVMQKDWSQEIFPDTEVQVKIKSKVIRSGLLIYTDIGG